LRELSKPLSVLTLSGWRVVVEGVREGRVGVAFHLHFCATFVVLDFLPPRFVSPITGAIVAWARLRPLWLYAMILQEGTVLHSLESHKNGRENDRVTLARPGIHFLCRTSDTPSVDFRMNLERRLHSQESNRDLDPKQKFCVRFSGWGSSAARAKDWSLVGKCLRVATMASKDVESRVPSTNSPAVPRSCCSNTRLTTSPCRLCVAIILRAASLRFSICRTARLISALILVASSFSGFRASPELSVDLVPQSAAF